MKKTVFTGVGTALITPMNEDGSIDYGAMERIVGMQLDAGIDALVVCATSGEAPTLTDREHIDVIKFVVGLAGGKVPVIAGTGSNYTDHACEMSRQAADAGADALLCVTPYYNKCTQKGLVRSYYKIADSTDLPVIVYNVPGRTGVDILPDTYAELARHDRIVGIKEANGNISSVVETIAKCGDSMSVYSGNDDQTVPIMALGGKGCISVMSNVIPAETKKITDLFMAGDIKGAAALQCRYKALSDALFSETNPIPVKAACSALGLCGNYLRLPLTPMEDAHREKLLDVMRKEGLNV